MTIVHDFGNGCNNVGYLHRMVILLTTQRLHQKISQGLISTISITIGASELGG
jgi:hypothetical protein